MNIEPYFLFQGNCREAMEFYKAALGGETTYMMFKDVPNMPPMPGTENMVMHAILKGAVTIMASDVPPDRAFESHGGQTHLCINVDTEKQVDSLFEKLAAGARHVDAAPQDMFWGARWANFEDKFGNHWMINFDRNPQR